MRHTFTVYGPVRGQGRPRTTKAGHVYKAQADRDYERSVKEAYINSGGPHFGDRPLALGVDVYRQLPESFPRRIRSERDVHKPDCTNIAKAVEDALNGIAYDDDRQIVIVNVVKHDRIRGRLDHVVVSLGELDDAFAHWMLDD